LSNSQTITRADQPQLDAALGLILAALSTSANQKRARKAWVELHHAAAALDRAAHVTLGDASRANVIPFRDPTNRAAPASPERQRQADQYRATSDALVSALNRMAHTMRGPK